jgi:molybdopterin-guanine dinucleotide biosynthesis protein A
MIVVVLAGGEGRRMGGNKPLYPWQGTTLIEATITRLKSQAEAIYINARRPGLERLGYPLVHDDPIFAGLGPLSGVRSALRLAVDLGRDAVVTAPCDMPFLPLDMVAQLMAHDTDIVHFGGERDYPLTTLWRSSLLPSLEAALIAARPEGGLKVMRYIASQRAVRIEAKDPAAFGNINRPEDI